MTAPIPPAHAGSPHAGSPHAGSPHAGPTHAESARHVAAAPGTTVLLKIGSVIALPVTKPAIWYCSVITVVLVIAAIATLSLGKLGIPPAQLVDALFSPPDGKAGFVLERLRGPRLVTAIGVGALLGLSGTLFQTVTRNPLGSPDIIGLGAGAGAGVAVTTLLWQGLIPTPVGALLGATAAIALVYWSTGKGFGSPARVIIAGIGVSAMAFAVTQYVVSIGMRDHATALAGYLAGTITASDWGDVAVLGATLAIVLPCAAALSGRLDLMAMGDDVANALGGSVNRTRTTAIILAVIAAAGAVTAAGPIAFVALTAPQIAKRATGSPGANLIASALTGAVILVVADLVTQQLPVANGLPVGVLTAGVGGIYLGYLLVREWSKGRV